jgi:hypothetical protein
MPLNSGTEQYSSVQHADEHYRDCRDYCTDGYLQLHGVLLTVLLLCKTEVQLLLPMEHCCRHR